jgi:hypothetical protein
MMIWGDQAIALLEALALANVEFAAIGLRPFSS